ncbi:MAG: hypothetical protein JOZ32_07705 [Bryobacterales bacterium]|nr:hypothetical protein [Bryobacterales bacterium]
MKDPQTIEQQLLAILASPTDQELLSKLHTYLQSCPKDESDYAQKFIARRTAAVEEAVRLALSPGSNLAV